MKWELIEPSVGDIIRVKAGTFFHYGIYVSDEEIIQFGLNPTVRMGIPETDIEVCISSVEEFLVDGFLEVGVCEKKDKKRFSKKKVVKLARSRLGEKGYHILYNNCEHFANECYFGEKYSSQTDNVRELFRNKPIVDVYLAQIPENDQLDEVFPTARQKEIRSITNVLVKREKYYVWKLLEYALQTSFGKKLQGLKIKKSSSGKWVCDECEFSLSHSRNLACVAVSKTVIGVDVEKIEKTKVDLSKEILSDSEYAEYSNLSESEKIEFIINAWTKKEALFKSKNIKSLSIKEFKELNGEIFKKNVYLNGEAFSLSVANENVDKVKVYENLLLK